MGLKQPLTIDNLGELSAGQSRGVINAALRAALRDTEDRGSDKKARKVTIEVEFKKLGDGVTATVRAKTGLPPYMTEPTIGSMEFDGAQPVMKFNPHSPGNPDQQTLPMGRGERDEE